MSLLHGAVVGTAYLTLVYFLVLDAWYATLTALAWSPMRAEVRARRYLALDDLFASPFTPGVSVLVPAYNEEAVIVESVRSLLALRYPRHEVIVVSDGSTDGTLQALRAAFDLVAVRVPLRADIPTAPVQGTFVSRDHPNLLVLDKENGGRSDALNSGINAARHKYVCVVDADSMLDEDALLAVAKPILDDPEVVAAAGGTIRIANSCRVENGRVVEVRVPDSLLATFQTLEYLRAFLVGRVAWSRLHAHTLISGAFGLFHRDDVAAAGGYWTDTVGEDLELTLRLHHHLRDSGAHYRIIHVPGPVCWTEVPADVTTLSRQRRRWQRGLWESLVRHRGMIGRPRYGAIGLLALPNMIAFEFLSPVFSLFGVAIATAAWIAGWYGTAAFAATLLAAIAFGLVLSGAALAIGELTYQFYPRRRQLLELLGVAVLECVGYRQLNSLWRGIAYVDIARGKKGWGAQHRQGFATASDLPASRPRT
jgi:cellulose synthase/poly-beta-1,6-N-acetylglucosamine synthase-like glycosyltransferase